MVAKPRVGDVILAYVIEGITWPGCEADVPVRGVVTAAPEDDDLYFRFMPNEPDETSNGGGNASVFEPNLGWFVDAESDIWELDDFVIHEEPELCL